MRILRRHEIEAKVGLGDRQIWELERKGLFPKRFTISPIGRSVGWLEDDVEAWIQARAETAKLEETQAS